MSWPIQPTRPIDPAGVARIDPARKVREREPRDEDERRQGGGRQPGPRRTPAPPVADADGHIDVLA